MATIDYAQASHGELKLQISEIWAKQLNAPSPSPKKKNTDEELDFKIKLNGLPQKNETFLWRTVDHDQVCFSPR